MADFWNALKTVLFPSAALQSAAWQQQTKPTYTTYGQSAFTAQPSPTTGLSTPSTQLLPGQGVSTPYSSPAPTGGTTTGGGGGQVLGTETYNPPSDTGGGGPSPEEILRNAWSGQVSGAYNEVFNYLDKMAGYLPEWKTEKEKGIQDLFTSQSGEIQSQQEAQMAKLGGYKTEITADQAANLKSLGETLRNWSQTGLNQLGVWGAGDSSSVGMYQFALAKEAAKRGTDIARQVSSMMNDIKMKEVDVQTAFNTAKNELDQWKTTNLQGVIDWFKEKQMGIEQQKANATAEKAQALAQMEISLMQQAYQSLKDIQTKAEEWNTGMKEWAINRMASIDDYRIQLGQLGQYSPQQIAWNELQGASQIPTTGGGEAYWNPYTAQLKKKTQDFASTWG